MFPRRRSSSLEALEQRVLFAVHTVDFNNYSVATTYFDWLLKDAHTPTTGFSYTIGTGAGQRPNINGITWADSTYYDTVLGAGGFNSVNAWNMKPLVVYSSVKNGDWINQGWNPYQDMAEGSACIDDAGRAAVTYADDYLLNGTESSYQTARAILTFVAYMTTRQGKTYNFAWLDSPAIFGWDPIQQGQDKHFEYRSEYVKRTAYPSATPNSSWFDQNSDTAHIIGWPNPTAAPPFMSHQKYSVYIDDLRDASNNDVATIYDGPLYTTAGGGSTSYKTGIKKTWSNSTQAFGFDEVRALQGLTRGIYMMQKRSSLNGGLSGDDLVFAKFLENDANRTIRNLQLQSVSGFDSKLGSATLAGLCDYYQALYGTTDYGTYVPQLPANSNTAETTDDRPSQGTVLSMIDQLATSLKAKQYRTADWRNGIFTDDVAGGNWDAWGQLQIYALARTYRLKINVGQNPADPAVSSLLDYAAYAADNFYGIEAYHYAAPGTNNVRTKERITGISGWSAQYHTNSAQIAYHNSSIVLGLIELARAYEVSDRADKAARMSTYLNDAKSVASWFVGNNTSLLDMYDGTSPITGTYRGRGTAFDGLSPSGGVPVINRNGGGESQDEGLWAVIQVKAAIAHYGLSSTFAYEQSPSGVAGPLVTAAQFKFDLPKPAITFNFNQQVGVSIDASDITIQNLTTGQVIPTSAMSLAYSSVFRLVTITIPGLNDGVFPDGQYRATIDRTGVIGSSVNPMAADYMLQFRVLAGDANGDGIIDFDDYVMTDTGYNAGLSGFSNGDFNYDGVVDFDDYVIIDAAYNNQ